MSRLTEIVAALEEAGLLVRAPTAVPEITGVTADSRRGIAGALYCAVRGVAQDGHAFVADAARAGAAAAMVEEQQPGSLPQVVVREGRRAAAVAAATWFHRPAARLELIGVTGTNGKTTCVTLLRHLLAGQRPTASLGTLGAVDPQGETLPGDGASLTTPGPVDLQATLAALIERGARSVAMEVSSHSLHQGRVEGLTFAAAVFTNFTRDHLDYHRSMGEYFRAKAGLLTYLAADGLMVVNGDDPAWQRLRRDHRCVTFGERGGDVQARHVEVDATGARFTLVLPTDEVAVRLPLLGRFNVANALAAAACAWGTGMPPAAVAERLGTAPQVPGRMERLATHPCTVLRDYAHTPDALSRALDALRPLTTGRVIVVFGAGGDRDRGKRAAMGEAAVRGAGLAILTSDNPRTEDPERILDDVEAGMTGQGHERLVDRRAAIARALDIARVGDTILLAGKGHETYQIIGTTRLPFDERIVVRELGAT